MGHRLNSDNVFFDYELINEAISLIRKDTKIELFSNVTKTKTCFTVEIIRKTLSLKIMNLCQTHKKNM